MNARGDVNNNILQWVVNQADKGTFDDIDMANMCRNMLGAGSETTANAMAWTMSFLVSKPSTLITLRKELDDAFRGSSQKPLPLETLKRLPYLDAVLHEALRLRSVASQVWRESEKDTELSVRDDEGNLKTFIIPAGTMAYIPIAAVQTSLKVLFGANEFYPERWLSDSGKDTEEEVFQF
ncbi:cytochrome P450 [Gonapodya prolifera JEL478]|uniref:Cytochrome P450 n=1 Tax=Gonapodya prolifera (strain JEL478) TaxID=1344416 RepID=A0A139AMG7_GONPJ|nr:cytochrome P450 [Gonapodya prolifera JEL478]|eukprot:KXS17949.1 cytochrome P450 [Gonapodya prolifera JEL478]